MSESRAEQVAEAVRAQLATIVGDGGTTYWYTPFRVDRHHIVDSTILDESLPDGSDGSSPRPLYIVSPDRQQEAVRSNGPNAIMRNTSYLTLTLLLRYTPATETPFQRDTASIPTRMTIQERMLRDVRKKLRADVKLTIGGGDGVSTYVALPDAELGSEATYIADGWACAFVRCVVTHHYTQDTP